MDHFLSGLGGSPLENIYGDSVKVLVYHTKLEMPLMSTLLLDSIVLVGKNLLGRNINTLLSTNCNCCTPKAVTVVPPKAVTMVVNSKVTTRNPI